VLGTEQPGGGARDRILRDQFWQTPRPRTAGQLFALRPAAEPHATSSP
jgi:hypothetical protein